MCQMFCLLTPLAPLWPLSPAAGEARHYFGPFGPFGLIRHLLKRRYVPHIKGIPPFIGGVAGYFGYDVAHFFDDTLLKKAFRPLSKKELHIE